jgi:ABC-type antimicrobial peptide transport system permease subunit
VLGLIVGQGMSLVGIGLAAGALLAFAGARAIQGTLYGVTPFDPATYLVTMTLLAVVALAANLVPALRAARVDPVVALRNL